MTNGLVQWISNNSGHYQPPLDYCKQILTELKRRGVAVNGIGQVWTGPDSKTRAKNAKKFGTTFERLGPKGVVVSRF